MQSKLLSMEQSKKGKRGMYYEIFLPEKPFIAVQTNPSRIIAAELPAITTGPKGDSCPCENSQNFTAIP